MIWLSASPQTWAPRTGLLLCLLMTWTGACSRTTQQLGSGSGGRPAGDGDDGGGDGDGDGDGGDGDAPARCGDGNLDPGEACDPPGLRRCADLGLGNGEAQCTDSCGLDERACAPAPSCAPARPDVPDACVEALCACDPDATAACDESCFDTVACVIARCPGFTPDCVLSNCLFGGFSDALLTLAPCLQGAPACQAAPTGTCGDGVLGPGEECEGVGVSCAELGLGRGTAPCDPDTCRLGLEACEMAVPVCGDGVAEGEEACDGADLRGVRCGALGFVGGELACDGDCTLDSIGCHNCGDGIVQDVEQCDGDNLDGRRCADLGYTGGRLACEAGCGTFEVTGCAVCGNGVVEEGEGCDRATGRACADLGLGAGQVTCSPRDCQLDTSGCEAGPACGNGIIETGETCDGAALGGQTCEGLGFAGGSLRCNPDTCRLVTIDCLERDPNQCLSECIDARCGESIARCEATPGCPEFLDCLDVCHDSPNLGCVASCAPDLEVAALAIVVSDCISDCGVGCR